MIEKIAAAKIEVDLTGRMESITESLPFTLCDAKDQPVDAELVTANVSGVDLTLKIQKVKELQLIVNVIDGGGADKENVTISHQSIQIAGNDNLLEGFDSLELGTVNLAEILEDTVLTFPVKLPEGVTNESGVPEITVTVEVSKLAVKNVKVTGIEAINVPDGLMAELITQRLDIQIRGPKKAVESIDESKIVAKVDFTEAQVGMATVKAQIVIETENVGAVGIYNVTANLTQAQ